MHNQIRLTVFIGIHPQVRMHRIELYAKIYGIVDVTG